MALKDTQAEIDKLAQMLMDSFAPARMPGEDQLPPGAAPRGEPGVLPLPRVWPQGADADGSDRAPWEKAPLPWDDVKPEILTFAADIKVPTEGPIQILEVMPAHIAGSSGYRYANRKSMVADVIMPDLQAQFPGVGITDKPWNTTLADFGEKFGHDAIDCERAIIYPGMMAGGAEVLRRNELHLAARQTDVVTVNADHNILALLENKAVQSYLADSDPDVARYFAPSIALPTRYEAGMTDTIFAKIGGDHEHYVIKPVEEIQGNGVRVVPRDGLDEFLKKTLDPQRVRKPVRMGRDFWQSDISPVFVVQPLVQSKPVVAFQPVMGEYDGTLRVFMSFVRRSPEEDFQIKIHDGYWKLPLQPLEKGKSAKSLISSSPYRPEDQRVLRNLFNALTRQKHHGTHFATAMDKATREHVFAQLSDVMPRYLKIMQDKPLYDRIADWLHSADEAECGTGVMMAVQRDYYVNSKAAPLARNAHSFPSEFFEHLAQLQQGRPNHSAVLFLQHALRDVTRPMALVARDVLRPLAERYQSDRYSDMMFRAVSMMLDRD